MLRRLNPEDNDVSPHEPKEINSCSGEKFGSAGEPTASCSFPPLSTFRFAFQTRNLGIGQSTGGGYWGMVLAVEIMVNTKTTVMVFGSKG